MAEDVTQGSSSSTVPPNTQLPLSLQHRSKTQGVPTAPTSKFNKQSADDMHEARHTTEHTFLTDVADVRQMEHSLLQLLDDFHLGKLQAFGLDCTFEKMDEVRERQERLARLHFDLDSHQANKGSATELDTKNFDKLMTSLHDLCTAVQNLQKDEEPASLAGHSH
jgi:hypothetical protein